MRDAESSRESTSPQGQTGLSQIAAEFKILNDRRKAEGLRGKDADRYYALFARLSQALAGGERRRRMDARQFLRVPGGAVLVLCGAEGERTATCRDFGGGGCAVDFDGTLAEGERVQMAALIVGNHRVPLPLRAEVIWNRPNPAGGHLLGLRFSIDSPGARDAVDRALYRVLDAFLT